MSDLELLFRAEEKVTRWIAERNYASSQLDLAMIRRNMRHLISQHGPLRSLDVDREKLRIIFSYLEHGNTARLKRENAKRKESENLASPNNTQEG